MIEDCVFQARLNATVAVVVGVLFLCVLSRAARHSGKPPNHSIETVLRHRWRFMLTPFVIITYGFALLARADVRATDFASPVIACAIEEGWTRITMISVAMIGWMYYITLPFLHIPRSKARSLVAHRSVAITGLFLCIGVLAMKSWRIAGWDGEGNWIDAVAKLTAIALGLSSLGARFKAARRGVWVLWPTVLIPTPSVYSVALILAFTIASLICVFVALDKQHDQIASPKPLDSVLNRVSGRRLREVASHERFEQIDGDEYLNAKHGIRIRGLNEWIVQERTREFQANGGFIALGSPEGGANINLSSGPLNPLVSFRAASGTRLEFVQLWERHVIRTFEEDKREFDGDSVRRLQLTNIDGEREVLWLECSNQEGRIGKICALHGGDEYVLFYFVRRDSVVAIEDIVRNWRWFMRLRAGLPPLGRPSHP